MKRQLRRSTLLACVAMLGAAAVVPSSVSQLAQLMSDPPAAHDVALGDVPVKPVEQDEAARRALNGSSTVDWPAAGTADVDVSRGEDVKAGNLPITVGDRDGRVRVELLDRDATEKAGVRGVAFRVSGDGGPLSVGVDYGAFRQAFGGDWATRLRLVRMSDGTVVPSHNDSAAGKLTADVDLPGSADATVVQGAAPGGVLFALLAAAESSDGQGDFAATPLAPSATWQVSQQTGDFNWNYPVKVPAVPGGLQPSFSVGYASSRIDGRTASTNNQPSWIGEGWDMWSGYVERRFSSCAENTEVVADKTADRCWFDENASIVLGGQASQVVKDADTGALKLKNEDGSKVERLFGASNGDVDGEYWRITKGDGTQYHFGLNKLEGWADGKPQTNSAWTSPVFERQAGKPCNKPAFKDSWCDRAWRWNLDYVVDKYGNSMTYYYNPEGNFYGRHRNDAAAWYTRGGTIDRVEYGTRKGNEYAGAPAEIKFETAERCVPGSACATSDYKDVPFDQKCDGGTCPDRISPTFWSTKRLTKIITRTKKADGGWQDVDSWSFGHSFPDTGDSSSPALWLTGITHAGHVGDTIALPEVTFDGKRLANRVGGTAGFGGYLPLYKYRLTNIYSESGGRVTLDYHDSDCERDSRLPNKDRLDENGLRCYPVKWAPENRPEAIDWFNKFVVRSVVETDRTGGAPDQKTTYDYLEAPAWHYTDDEITPERLRTWSEWRGYAKVRTEKAGTRVERLFYRGMNGDRTHNGGQKPVKLKDSENQEFDDVPAAQGFQREEITYDRPGGAALIKTITKPETFGPFARDGSLESWMVRAGETRTYTKLSSGVIRTTTSTPKYNTTTGVVEEVDDRGDDNNLNDNRCVKNTYASRDDIWLKNLVVATETWGKACFGGVTAEQVLSASRVFYDGSTDLGVIPGVGEATLTKVASAVVNGELVYSQTARSAYDTYGRVTDSYDALDRRSTTSYTHTQGLLTKQVMTNAKGFSATVDLDPALGQPVKKTDANNGVTHMRYDALGRLSKVHVPGRDPLTQSANAEFQYLVRKDKVTAVGTTTLGSTGNKVTGWAIYDGLLRPRQTQTEAPYTGRQLTDTFYNDRGMADRTASLYYNKDSLPTSELVQPPTGNQVALPSVTQTSYDVLGRAVSQKFIGLGQDRWTSTVEYGGDWVKTTPPPGGTATTVLTDARGQTTELRQHKAPTPTGDYDATKYTYTKSGQLETVTDAAGNVWRNTYDLRGRKTGSVDPDTGETTSTFDDAGQLTSARNSAGKTVRFEYDVLGRKTGSFQDSTQLAAWTYDTVAKGLPTASVRNPGGDEYRSEVTAYDPAGRATASKIVIPAVEGTGIAGTYETKTKYGQDGSVSTVELPKAGDLAKETLQYLYTKTGQADFLSGATTYVEKATYNEYAQLAQLHLDTGIQNKTKWVQLNYTYEADTRRLSTADVLRRASPNTVPSKSQYNYDAVGNIKSVIEAPTSFKTDAEGNITTLPNENPNSVDYQCFQYDHVRQLTEAWAGKAKCAAEPSQSVVGGPAPYWQSFRYDKAGNRTKEIEHASGGDTTSEYTYPATGGHLLDEVKSTGPTGQQLSEFDYDSTGNMTRRVVNGTTRTMEWNAEGRLTKESATGKDTTFVYDADGNRLLRKDPNTKTLYLGTQEMTLVSGATVARGTRYYSIAGQQVAVRTAAGISWQFGDHQGTQQISIGVNDLAVTQRRQTPFGESRGAAPTSWPDDKGFVGGTKDPSGLTHLGAREYDSDTGRFISADPVMVLDDPQQINGYAYANSSPLTFSDPTGLKREDDHPICVGIYGDCGIDPTTMEGSAVYGEYTQEQLAGMGVLREQVEQAYASIGTSAAEVRKAQEIERQSWVDVALQAGGEILKELLGINDMAKCFGEGDFGACASMVLGVIPWGKILKAGKIAKALDNAFTAVKAFMKQQAWAKGLLSKARDMFSRGCNSFTPDTAVLMADGSRKPIASIRVGDEVLATDPETGRTEAKTVANLIIGTGEKNLVEITVDADGAAGGTVTATAGHPFWLPDRGGWVEAGELREGSLLQTSAGTWVQVTAVRKWTAHERVYNLTVTDIHTYFVVAGTQPILNHNAARTCPVEIQKGFPNRELPRNAHGVDVPDVPDAPHTQLGIRHSKRTDPYRQAREWDGNGNKVRDIDFTDHRRPRDHPNPHQHKWLENETGGSLRRGDAEPLE